MSNLKDELIKLGSKNPSLQKHLRPIIDKLSVTFSGPKGPGDFSPPGGGPPGPEFPEAVRREIEQELNLRVKDVEGYAPNNGQQEFTITMDVPATKEGFKKVAKRLLAENWTSKTLYKKAMPEAKKLPDAILDREIFEGNVEIEGSALGDLKRDSSKVYFTGRVSF